MLIQERESYFAYFLEAKKYSSNFVY